MAQCFSNGKIINYIVHGENGDYLMLVNGLMMTTNSWLPLIPTLKENFRVICVDLHDMGASEKMTEQYTVGTQCDAVLAVADALHIQRINLCGTSYGGTVSLLFALKYPDRVNKLMVFNTLAYSDTYLTEVGRLWQKGMKSYDADEYYDCFVPFIYAPSYFEAHKENIYKRKEMLRSIFKDPKTAREYCDSIYRLSVSAEGYDVRDKLKDIQCPVLVGGCDQDYLTPMPQQQLLSNGIPNARFVLLPGGGHGVVYEKSELIVMLAIGWFRDIKTIPVF